MQKDVVKKFGPFPSSSSDASYEVIQWSDGTYSCNCRGWIIKKPGQERRCRHTDQVAANGAAKVVPITKAAKAKPSVEKPIAKSKDVPQDSTGLPPWIKPMLAHPGERQSYQALMAQDRFVAEPKYDGQRALVIVRDGKTVACYSRLGNELISTKQNGCGWIAKVVWPFKSATLDCELCSEWGRNIAGKDAAHARSTAGLELGLVVFDLLEFGGKDLKESRWTERRAELERAFKKFKHAQIQVTPVSYEPAALWKAWVEKLGGEGIMLKDKKAKYAAGKRSWLWLKLTPEVRVDVIITGVATEDHSGKPFKTAEAALTYGYWDPKKKKAVTVGQGLGPALLGSKEALLQHVGKIAEVRCKGVMLGGSLRSAFFVRWRTDKTAQQCTMPGI